MYKLPYQIKLNQDLLLFYLLWPIVIAPKEIQFVVIVITLIDLLRRHRLYLDALSYVMIVFITIYLFSIVYNLIGHSFELDRILATINTVSIWIISLIFYMIFRSINIDLGTIKKITFINYCILIVLWMCSLLVYKVTNSPYISVLNKPLYYTEWFGDMKVIRFVGFMDYPNLIIMFFMFFYPLYILYIVDFRNKLLKVVLIIAGLLPILTTFSRSGYLIVLTYVIAIGVYYVYKTMNQKLFLSIAFITFSITLGIVGYTNFSKDILFLLQELLNAREGSNDSRSYLMMESIRVTLDSSPIVGMGIKVTSLIGYPLGSHSTFLGFFYRTGIVGFIVGTALFLIITLKILFSRGNLEKTSIKISLLLMPLLFFVEDIDGANWLIVFYFLLVALIVNHKSFLIKPIV